ncbi:membrane protein insertase YidC [Gordonia rubripertincta]|uniref:Membrane protein insertase YidC n=2 Tax=Gordonia rubripertincta TaxID=36822 RepID=A0AAW4FZ39_GORRU|nr:membrane protein insertase YidC [Gordonia rubripertincta]MBM7276180.1 membrane protein insertase YidC [Gordonia rubripertincta]MDG6782794.1 membrane protein insertase YidC [Gordonia rubripertincta]NKY64003.1 membrane protein insertase YidC [Gordonia rubripertincta]QMU21764.1 membrane protein insertase YidC [Gordonia rubripertincta]GAB87378.1 OxaA family protein [Gordonia rubripertincta NBRC 101908]
MLDFIYYPVSGIMWVWHWLFSYVTPDSPGGDGIAWALSVVFLVFTLRAILYKPFVKQIRTTKKMQEINPQLQAIRKKYAKDRVKMTEEMQKLQKEHGFNPLLGCLPMLLQIPVFIGLFHVLRSFNRMGTGMGQLGMSAAETRAQGNYVFSAEQVQNFLDARLFGVPLSSYLVEPVTEFQAFVEPGAPIDFTRVQIGYVIVPMMIIASIATHMNSRASVARQPEAALENPQTRMMNNLALYIFPIGILITGPFFPVAILLYWMSNNIWTYGQQHLVFGKIEKEEEEAKRLKQEKLKANAPKPGARPDRQKKRNTSADASGDSETTAVSMTKAGTTGDADTTSESSPSETGDSAPSTKPKPGQKPTRSGAGAGPGSKKQPPNRGGKSTAKSGKKRGKR